jgi:hypothetical protein
MNMTFDAARWSNGRRFPEDLLVPRDMVFSPYPVRTWVVGVVAIFIGESCAAQPGSKCRGVMQLNGTANADFPGVATKASSLTL